VETRDWDLIYGHRTGMIPGDRPGLCSVVGTDVQGCSLPEDYPPSTTDPSAVGQWSVESDLADSIGDSLRFRSRFWPELFDGL
jgi:hypothetical protein